MPNAQNSVFSPDTGLVRLPAIMSSVPTCFSWISPLQILSRMWWCLISMCFDHSRYAAISPNFIVLWLSQKTVTRLTKFGLNSLISCLIQSTSRIQRERCILLLSMTLPQCPVFCFANLWLLQLISRLFQYMNKRIFPLLRLWTSVSNLKFHGDISKCVGRRASVYHNVVS